MSGPWNYDMEAAPRGHFETVTRKGPGGRTHEVTRHVSVPLIAASSEGGVVTLTRWIPDEGRWNMFTKDAPPMAWMPWPTHPGAAQ